MRRHKRDVAVEWCQEFTRGMESSTVDFNSWQWTRKSRSHFNDRHIAMGRWLKAPVRIELRINSALWYHLVCAQNGL